MRLVFLLTLVVFPGLAAAQLKNGPVDLDGRVDARPLPLQRVRWQDGTIWVPTRYAREALGWEVERFAPHLSRAAAASLVEGVSKSAALITATLPRSA